MDSANFQQGKQEKFRPFLENAPHEQFIADREVGRFAAGLVEFVVGGLQDMHHPLEN